MALTLTWGFLRPQKIPMIFKQENAPCPTLTWRRTWRPYKLSGSALPLSDDDILSVARDLEGETVKLADMLRKKNQVWFYTYWIFTNTYQILVDFIKREKNYRTKNLRKPKPACFLGLLRTKMEWHTFFLCRFSRHGACLLRVMVSQSERHKEQSVSWNPHLTTE